MSREYSIKDVIEERVGYVYSEEGIYEPHEITFTVEVGKKVEIGDIVCIEHPSRPGTPVFYQVIEVPLRRRARDYEEDLVRLGKPVHDESRNYPRARAKQVGYYEDFKKVLEGESDEDMLMLIEHIKPLSEVYRPKSEVISLLLEPNAPSIEVGSIYPSWKHTLKLELPKLLRQGLLVVGGVGTGKTTTMLTILVNIIRGIRNEGGNPHILIIDKDGEYGTEELMSVSGNSYEHIDIDRIYIGEITDKYAFYQRLLALLGLHPTSRLARSLKEAVFKLRGPIPLSADFIRSLCRELTTQDLIRECMSRSANIEKRLESIRSKEGISVSEVVELTKNLAVVHIDLSRTTDMDHVFEVLTELLRRVYNEALHNPEYGIIVAIDEAHLFAPERGGIYIADEGRVKALKSTLELLATTGARNGVTLFIATQRPSLISKTLTTQMGQNIIAHRVEDVDLERVVEIMGSIARRARVLPRGWALVKALAAKLKEPLIIKVNPQTYPTSTGKTAYERFLESTQ